MAQKAWMRVLKVTLTNSKGNQLIFDEPMSISVRGDKYMSTLKDSCTIQLQNLTYVEIIRIIEGQFYNVKVECGYKSASVQTIFDGGVMYVSNRRDSIETKTVTILCASRLVAHYGQRRLNLSFNSGINLYSAINFVCKLGGTPNPNISTQFKKRFLQEINNCQNQSAASWINDLTQNNGSFIANSDYVGNSAVTLFDAARSNCRIIKLNTDNIVFTNGHPCMTTEGLVLSVLPTFAFQCGDTIVIDNAIIDIDVQTRQDAAKNLGALLDQNGQYMIFEIHYSLSNRGNEFYLQFKLKTRSRITAYLAKE